MKNTFKLAAIIATGFLGALSADAARTNLVQTLNIRLTAYFQGPTVTNGGHVTQTVVRETINSQDVIRILGAATSNSFSSGAKLLVVRPLPDGDPMVVVRDGSNTVAVTRFFSQDLRGTPINRSRLNTATGFVSGQQYGSRSFELEDADGFPDLTGHFEVRGLTLVSYVSLLNGERQIIGVAEEYVAAVTGTGEFNDQRAILSGTISGKGRTIEVSP